MNYTANEANLTRLLRILRLLVNYVRPKNDGDESTFFRNTAGSSVRLSNNFYFIAL